MKFYIGVRYAEGCHPNEFWKTYFTSSNYIIACRDLNGEPDHIETFTFATANEAVAKELFAAFVSIKELKFDVNVNASPS